MQCHWERCTPTAVILIPHCESCTIALSDALCNKNFHMLLPDLMSQVLFLKICSANQLVICLDASCGCFSLVSNTAIVNDDICSGAEAQQLTP